MNREQLIARFNERFPDHDPAAVYDWATEATENDTVLVPLNYVDDLCNDLAQSLQVEA